MKHLFIFTLFAALLLAACSKEEATPFATPYIHIMDNEASSVNVSENANAVSTYNVYYSTPHFIEPLTVTYKITAGNGLTQGVDYELVNPGTALTFLPGIYDMPIRIKWMANAIDTTKNNTVTIELVSNDKGIIMGLPGPDGKQKSLTITKVK